jgi:hypothetical protein
VLRLIIAIGGISLLFSVLIRRWALLKDPAFWGLVAFLSLSAIQIFVLVLVHVSWFLTLYHERTVIAELFLLLAAVVGIHLALVPEQQPCRSGLPSRFFLDSLTNPMTKSADQTTSRSPSSGWRWLSAAAVALIAISALGWFLLSDRHVEGPETSLTEAFMGNWDTQADASSYRMTLNSMNGEVSGSYSGAASGTVTGTIDDAGKFIFSWTEGNNTGTGIFVLSPDRNSFNGHYSNNGDPNKVTGTWTGTRM